MISIIVAMANNGVIGNKNELPWYLPADLKHFSQITKGHSVIMGRKTFESILKSIGKPLPERKNIIITRQKDFLAPNTIITSSLEEALQNTNPAEENFVIGGAEIYTIALPHTYKLYITHVDADIPGDVKFPNYNPEDWDLISNEQHIKDEKNQFNYTFTIYERK